MCTTLFDNGYFAYFADLTPVPAPVGGHCLTISSRLASSRDSQAEQVRFRACLADAQLLGLARLIQQQIAGCSDD
jgi:hypothetical protein